jgi:hypothetical protein
MLSNIFRDFELLHFLDSDLSGVRAHHEVNLVRGAIDLLKQALQVNCSAGPGCCNNEFHGQKKYTDSVPPQSRGTAVSEIFNVLINFCVGV